MRHCQGHLKVLTGLGSNGLAILMGLEGLQAGTANAVRGSKTESLDFSAEVIPTSAVFEAVREVDPGYPSSYWFPLGLA